MFIEAKGRDAVEVPNRLHVVMASNEHWIVPASEDERRYAVFQVSDAHKQDEAWFGPLAAQMRSGGYEAMLYDLLHMDIGDWHPRRIPRTGALLQQQARNLSPEDAWWCELLEVGVLWGADPKQPSHAVSNAWKQESFSGLKDHKGLYDQARAVSPRMRGLSDHLLGAILSGHGCTNGQKGHASPRMGIPAPGRSPRGLGGPLPRLAVARSGPHRVAGRGIGRSA